MPTDFNIKDPFTQVYEAIWNQLEDEEWIDQNFPDRNRIRYDTRGDRHPDKRTKSSRDYPEIRIIGAGGTYGLFYSSTNSRVIERFDIQIRTGDMRAHRLLWPAKWHVLRAMAKTQASNLGLSFVTDLRFESVDDFPGDVNADPINQWVSVLRIFVDMDFNTASQLQA